MPTTPPPEPGGAPETLGPEVASATQSAANQDLDRQLKDLAEEHKAQVQALETVLETRRQALLLESGQDPSVTTPERVSREFFRWHLGKSYDPNAPPGGSSSTAQGAASTEPARAKMPPLPPPRTSGLSTGAAPVGNDVGWNNRQKKQRSPRQLGQRSFKIFLTRV